MAAAIPEMLQAADGRERMAAAALDTDRVTGDPPEEAATVVAEAADRTAAERAGTCEAGGVAEAAADAVAAAEAATAETAAHGGRAGGGKRRGRDGGDRGKGEDGTTIEHGSLLKGC
jgi:hypothetical protein